MDNDSPLRGKKLTNVNGVLPVMGLSDLLKAERKARGDDDEVESLPVLSGIAAHVYKCWQEAKQAKVEAEERMLKSLRQRRGTYDPDLAAELLAQNSSDIYMMITANKCRSALAWLRDTLLGVRDEKPWTLVPTKVPSISPAEMVALTRAAAQEVLALEQQLGVQVSPEDMKNALEKVRARARNAKILYAKQKLQNMEDKMEDQLAEGNFTEAFNQFLDDFVTFPAAVLKGPVIRNKPTLQWVQGSNGGFRPKIKKELVKEWERVDPFMIYPAPHSSGVNDGYIIERHRILPNEFEAFLDMEDHGYSNAAIHEMIEEYRSGGYHEWLGIDSSRADAEGRDSGANTSQDGLIDALQFWGQVSGSLLREWGMTDEQVPDDTRYYHCEVWVVGRHVIKVAFNQDPLGRTPYYKSSYENIPGAFWGNSVPDLVRDDQAVCNAAARALVNNMGIASGPQVEVNVSRLADGEDVEDLYPWQIRQTKSDPYGASGPAVTFYQPNLLAGELMAVYEKFSQNADEHSSIPRYLAGEAAGTAGRTASGLSMLMSNAGKALKNVIANIDQDVITKVLDRLYYYNMRYEDDPELKGDIRVVARGANALVVKEQAAVRRNEFMQLALNNQTASQIMGPEGVAYLLREGAKTLDMDTEKIVPSDDELQARELMMAQAQRQTLAQPGGATLQDGTPTTNNFLPPQG